MVNELFGHQMVVHLLFWLLSYISEMIWLVKTIISK